MTDRVIELAAAKVNLCLHVTGRRDDGYHVLDSMVVFADFGDELVLERAKEMSLDVCGPFADGLSADSDNLVLSAARALVGADVTAKIRLTKNLPVASGIGGGSADAAAALRGVLALAGRHNYSNKDVHQLAIGLGADVPACLVSQVLRMSGIGEKIDKLPPLPTVPAILVNPLVSVLTGPVFAELGISAGASSRGAPISGSLANGFRSVETLASWLQHQRNDLEAPAIKLVPAISEVLSKILDQNDCLLARMSGSGATCFGLFSAKEQAVQAADALSRTNPDWWVKATSLQ